LEITTIKFPLIVNPHSGKKQSRQILELLKPVFDLHGAELTILETTEPGNARDLVKHLDLAVYDGIIVLGGDGTFHEVVNGLLKRPDGVTLPLGLIPGGSGNHFSMIFIL